jgi:hypothetical protein
MSQKQEMITGPTRGDEARANLRNQAAQDKADKKIAAETARREAREDTQRAEDNALWEESQRSQPTSPPSDTTPSNPSPSNPSPSTPPNSSSPSPSNPRSDSGIGKAQQRRKDERAKITNTKQRRADAEAKGLSMGDWKSGVKGNGASAPASSSPGEKIIGAAQQRRKDQRAKITNTKQRRADAKAKGLSLAEWKAGVKGK